MGTHNSNNYDIEDTQFGTSFGYQSDEFRRFVKKVKLPKRKIHK